MKSVLSFLSLILFFVGGLEGNSPREVKETVPQEIKEAHPRGVKGPFDCQTQAIGCIDDEHYPYRLPRGNLNIYWNGRNTDQWALCWDGWSGCMPCAYHGDSRSTINVKLKALCNSPDGCYKNGEKVPCCNDEDKDCCTGQCYTDFLSKNT
ncbi:hypothetical protein Bealeia1_00701 [Candidatus Bealeia paramacronuclearis]|uniref:Uncharacterized protein n=1 Tax=Candidatus Bealeia paramacronuclearis TaxID=1921001 RepID=A0ABZ2C242_9PROT|nr:hypothetical protein [Candidatus Bealeia paramacronuclearis]